MRIRRASAVAALTCALSTLVTSAVAPPAHASTHPAPAPTRPALSAPVPTRPHLAERDLARADVTDPSASRPAITGSSSNRPDVIGPDLTGRDVTNSSTSRLDVTDPGLADPDLTGPHLAGSNLARPDLAERGLIRPDVTEGDPDVTDGDTDDDIAGPRQTGPNLAKPNLAKPNLTGPDLTDTDLAKPDLTGPDLTDTDLAKPDLAGPDLTDTDLAKPNLAGPDLARPDLARPDLTGPDLAESLDAILDDPRLGGALAGVVVRAADNGQPLYARDAYRRMLPASTQKLLTSAAALEVLGPGYRFTTQVLADGVRRGPVLDGDLYLRGSGDPTLSVADYERLAAEVAARGIKVVLGGLVADDTWFDDVRLGADWAWGDEEFDYAGQISALTLSAEPHGEPGSIIVEVHPASSPGQPAAVRTVPETSHVKLVNRALTGAPGSQRNVTVEREHGTNVITVQGSIPATSAPLIVRRSVWDPTGYAASIFANALAEHGVKLVGTTITDATLGGTTLGTDHQTIQPAMQGTVGFGRGETPAGASVVARKQSARLEELLRPMLKLSINGYAEALVKAMGREVRGEGTAEAGLGVARGALDALGVESATLRIVDGSGLSRQNLLAPEHLADLLENAQREPWFSAWAAGFPVAGAPGKLVGGTLERRMVGSPAAFNAHAKTGTLTAVSALAGYVTNADGRRLVFVVLLNHYLGQSPKDIEDRIASTLAAWTETAATTEVSLTTAGRAGWQAQGHVAGTEGTPRAWHGR